MCTLAKRLRHFHKLNNNDILKAAKFRAFLSAQDITSDFYVRVGSMFNLEQDTLSEY